MERSFILGVVILIVLIAFTQGSPTNEENDPDLVSRDSLLEKLGMELHRDPVSNPSRKRAYWGWRPHRGYGRRKVWGGYTTADTSDEEE